MLRPLSLLLVLAIAGCGGADHGAEAAAPASHEVATEHGHDTEVHEEVSLEPPFLPTVGDEQAHADPVSLATAHGGYVPAEPGRLDESPTADPDVMVRNASLDAALTTETRARASRAFALGRSPLLTARRVLWRLGVGGLLLLLVHSAVARARRRLPKLQDDLLLVQLSGVVLVLFFTAISVLRAIQAASPLVAGGSLLAMGLAAVWVGARFLPRYVEGLYLLLGPTVRIGDQVAIEDDSGTLAEVGLTRLTLVREDGRRFSIPVASLGGARFSVQPRDHSAPVDVLLPAGAEPEAVRENMLAAALISPFRDPDTPVSAVVQGDTLRVHFVAWSPDVVEHAVRHLRRARERC